MARLIQSKRRMLVLVLAAFLAAPAFGAEPLYNLAGRIVPRGRAAVTLSSAASPFEVNARWGGNVMKKTYPAILGGALVGAILFQGFTGAPARAQRESSAQPVTIRSPFPLAEFAELLQGEYARPVTYEDALLVWRGDQDAAPATGRPELRTRVFTVPEGLKPSQAPHLDAALVRRALDAYHQQNDGPRFDVRESRMGVHIVPARVAAMDGDLAPSVNILDSVITVPPGKRTPTEHLDALCAALTLSSGVTITCIGGATSPLELVFLPNGNMPPRPIWTDADRDSLTFEWGAPGIPAQQALISLLDSSSTTLSWELRCQAGEARQGRKCILTIGAIVLRRTLPNGSIAVGPSLLYDRCTKCPRPGQPPLPLDRK
jgi:hypothetical protein